MGRQVRVTEMQTGQRLLTQVETQAARVAAEVRALQLEKRLQELEYPLQSRT